jgi:thioredoxin-like negative regulator of GroEL
MFIRILLCLGAFALLGTAETRSEGIAWWTDLDAAAIEARQASKVMMIDVYADWCGWCKKLDTDTYADARIVAKSRDFIPVKVNAETSPSGDKFAQTYHVSGFPTILFLEADGSVANKVVGFVDSSSLLDAMTKTVEYGPKVKVFYAEFRAGNHANSRLMLPMLIELARTDAAEEAFESLRRLDHLEPAFEESIAFGIAKKLVEDGQYYSAVKYLAIVESINSRSEAAWEAHLLRSVCAYYVESKAAALERLDQWLADPKTPEAWRDRYKELRARVAAAKDRTSK